MFYDNAFKNIEQLYMKLENFLFIRYEAIFSQKIYFKLVINLNLYNKGYDLKLLQPCQLSHIEEIVHVFHYILIKLILTMRVI